MTKTQFNVDTLLKSDAVRPFYAAAGATDLAVEFARNYVAGAQRQTQARVADVQKRVANADLEPKALQSRAVELVNARVDDLSKDAKARQARLEKAISDLQKQVNDAFDDIVEAYTDLATRGERLVGRIRRQQATQDAATAAKNTTARAKATKTSATKGAKSTKSSAKGSATSAKKAAGNAASNAASAAKSAGNAASNAASTTASAAKGTGTTAKKSAKQTTSTAKATGTTARKTAEKSANAAKTAATKVGDGNN